MTSGTFTFLDVGSIEVRENRQRQKIEGIEELAESIRRHGLINPIVVTRDHVLVAGERRLLAHRMLKFTSIAAQFVEDLDEVELELIELEENVRREDLTWQETALAMARFHNLNKEREPDWSRTRTQEALGVSKTVLAKNLLVVEALENGVPEVAEAPVLSTAYNFASRQKERAKAATVREINTTMKEAVDLKQDDIPDLPPSRPIEILNEDFTRWAQTLEPLEEPFNLIHCDFPYGVNAGDKKGQSAAKHLGGYEDTPEIYFGLINTFLTQQDLFIAPSAHLFFWFSMDYYSQTKELFEQRGWAVNPFPLVWGKSDNAGILPDPNRGPRRTYETAFLASRGDRKIVKPVSNIYWGATTKEYHMSEKPHAMLDHFFRMLVDSSTRMLDPTCGSGMALKVAEGRGAEYCLGLELNADYAEKAKENLGL